MDLSSLNMTSVGYALLSGVLPALLWLWFWLKEDNLHPEPKGLIFGTFLAGCVAVFFAIFLEKFVQEIAMSESSRYIAWAAIEEIIKFLAVSIIALKSSELDEPIDAMLYCVTVAVGFAALENTFFILSPIHNGEVTKSIITGNMRFLGATLVHVVSSASIGFMIGLSFYKGVFLKIISIIVGIALAITLHSVFNLSIINATAENTLKAFGLVWCMVIILLILFEEVKGIKKPSALTNK
jgi:RsiW-degrading membrane proteinase PrsW (M82 family)